VGCGGPESKLDRRPIFGKIVGAEGNNGVVRFLPTSGTEGPAVVGSLENGSYRFTTVNGPVPGKYNVSIEVEVSTPPARARPSRRGSTNDKIPANEFRENYASYDEPKTTTASVTVDGPLEIDLDVTK
jgi:hypothetical protein